MLLVEEASPAPGALAVVVTPAAAGVAQADFQNTIMSSTFYSTSSKACPSLWAQTDLDHTLPVSVVSSTSSFHPAIRLFLRDKKGQTQF